MGEFSDAPLAIDRVALTVHDLDAVGDFYRDAVGLADIAANGDSRALGVGGDVLLELRRDRQAARRSPRDAGLFHTAFLLPARADLGRWLGHAAALGLPLEGASDHAVSEAVYLSDPEGNGIEIYADRPRASWPWADGAVAMRTDRLDTADLLGTAGAEPWRGAPAGTTVGHVHLQVGALPAADAFYNGVLGLDGMARYPGASFFGAGGYHHHLAANVWNSRNAAPRDRPATGLANVRIRLRDPALGPALAARAEGAGLAVGRDGTDLTLRDPWNTTLTFAAAG